MLTELIAEATEIDFKVALEVKKPKSWLKSVSAFANGIGGVLLFGVDDDRSIVGLTNAQQDAEAIAASSKSASRPCHNLSCARCRRRARNYWPWRSPLGGVRRITTAPMA